MSIVVNTNVMALVSARNHAINDEQWQKSHQQLSSGKRINSAADDAAGLKISSRLMAQTNGLKQATRNVNDGISVAQTAEAAIGESVELLQKMRVMALQSANGSNTAEDRIALQQTFFEYREMLTTIATETTFGGQPVIDGTYSEQFQVGADANQTIPLDLPNSLNANSLGLGLASVSTIGEAQTAVQNIDTALAQANGVRADLGAKINRFQSVIRHSGNTHEQVSAATSRIQDTDFAVAQAQLVKSQVLSEASGSMLSQANQQPELALSLIAA